MMDFWHCHKPHEKGDTEKDKAVKRRLARDASSGRGIGGFIALEGVGLVDLTFFLVNRRDVGGVEVVKSEKVCDKEFLELHTREGYTHINVLFNKVLRRLPTSNG